MVALDPTPFMSPSILIIFCGIVIHGIDGLAIRQGGGDTLIEYVYDVPLPMDQDFDDDLPDVYKSMRQPSRVSYDFDLNKAIGYPNHEEPEIYDTENNYKPYQREELIFSPGNLNELRVRPDGSAVFPQNLPPYDPEMESIQQRHKKDVLNREITNNGVEEEEEGVAGRELQGEPLDEVAPLTKAEDTPENVMTSDDESITETERSQETGTEAEENENEESVDEVEEDKEEESEEDTEASDENSEDSKQETVEVSDEEESNEASDSETETSENSEEEESEVTTFETPSDTEEDTPASVSVRDIPADEVTQVVNGVVGGTENAEENVEKDETSANASGSNAEETQATLLEEAIKKFEAGEKRNTAVGDYYGGIQQFDVVLRDGESITPYLEKREGKEESPSLGMLPTENQAPANQEDRNDEFPSWSLESSESSEEDDDGVDTDELDEEEQATTPKARNLEGEVNGSPTPILFYPRNPSRHRHRRESLGDDYYVDMPRTRNQYYNDHPYPSFIGTHHRYKRSVTASGPIMSGPRAMLVNGQKVFVDTPQLAFDDEGDVSVDRKTRQTIQEFISVPTPKAARFPPQFCELDRDSGIICPGIKRGIFLDQFYYDSETNRCSHFVYNGCGGNANRFSTLWECTQFCGKHHDEKSKKK